MIQRGTPKAEPIVSVIRHDNNKLAPNIAPNLSFRAYFSLNYGGIKFTQIFFLKTKYNIRANVTPPESAGNPIHSVY